MGTGKVGRGGVISQQTGGERQERIRSGLVTNWFSPKLRPAGDSEPPAFVNRDRKQVCTRKTHQVHIRKVRSQTHNLLSLRGLVLRLTTHWYLTGKSYIRK